MSDEAHLSAKQPGPGTTPRFPSPDGDGRRTQGPECSPRPRPQEAQRLAAPLAVLRKRSDFVAANKTGRRGSTPGFLLLVNHRADGDPSIRAGFTVTKKIGNAVVRNRMKRRFRALARDVLPSHGLPGADHVMVGRSAGIERDFDKLHLELVKALDKLRR